MLVLEKLIGMAKGVAEHAHEVAAGSGSFRVFIGNSSSSRLAVVGTPHLVHSTANISFTRLEPGRAGLVRVDGQGEIGAALEFSIGDESILLGMHRPRVRGPSFAVEFAGIAGRRPGDFYRAMPREFVGAEGTHCCIQGTEFAVFVGHVSQGTNVAVHLLLGPKADIARLPTAPELSSRSCIAPGALQSGLVLEFAGWCRDRSPSNLGKALFVLELIAMQAGLDRLDLTDQAFAVDVLIVGFVTSGILGLGQQTLESELQAWRDRRPAALGEAGSEAAALRPRYDSYHVGGARAPTKDMEAYVDVGLLLLKAAGMQCALALRSVLRDFHASGDDGADVASFSNAFVAADGPRWGLRRPSAAMDTNCTVMAQHLLPTHDLDSGGEDAPALSHDEVVGVMAAAQQCIHDAADHTLRRAVAFDALDRAQEDPAVRHSIQHYRSWVPPLRHRFEPNGSADEVRHESWASEIFAGLDGGRDTDPDFILQSLGRGAPPYQSMSTNSKSGEFFFFSGDRRFLIKTVTENEAQLLFRMLPAYQAHIRRLPGSLIVRYAGLHCARIPGLGLKYFTVMVSVFDPGLKVHETFDVKGSLLHRRSKAGESIGKDENWVEAGLRLHVPEDLRLELREAHEQDAAFLASFGVMDYSLLIGIHHLREGGGDAASSSSSAPPAGRREPGGGLRATVGQDIYFVGLIDFLIAFGLKKQAEHLLRVAQGHAEDASCVDPLSYATRQVRFVQDSVLCTPDAGGSAPSPSPPRQRCKYGAECYRKNQQHKSEYAHPGDVDWDPEAAAAARADRVAAGRLGTLRASIASARNLINADIGMDLSDPYVTVALGLQRARTHTVMDNLNPEWNCTLRLAVDEAHRSLVIDISVWDEDQYRTLQGSDDFLGRLQVPLARVMEEGPLDVHEKLRDVGHGELSLRLEFAPLEPRRST